MQGTIQQANPSKSGKTLSVQINGQWYSTKHFELQNMVGQEITAQTSESEFNGTVMHWLNDYSPSDAATTPAGQAFNQAHTGGTATQQASRGPEYPPQTATVDRDTNITALALVKCVQGLNTPIAAYAAYCELYQIIQRNPNPGVVKQGNVVPEGHVEGYDQEIPF